VDDTSRIQAIRTLKQAPVPRSVGVRQILLHSPRPQWVEKGHLAPSECQF
jgi:hypothetical protein